MLSLTDKNNYPSTFLKTIFYILVLNVIVFSLINIFTSILSDTIILLICAIPLVIILLFNFNITYGILLISLFIQFYFGFTSSVWFSLFVIISLLITFKNISIDDFKSPLNLSFIIYLISILPSFINAQRPFTSLIMLYHLVALFLIFTITKIYFSTENKISFLLKGYLALVLLNTITIFIQSIFESKRTFGFAGIMYVDYVGIAIMISVVHLTFTNGVKKILWFMLLSIFVTGLIFTQTRSAWLVSGFSISLFVSFLFYKSNRFNLNRFKLIFNSAFIVVVIIIIYLATTEFNPKIAERATEYASSEQALDKRGYAVNSLVTRMLIWSTAYNAFMAHPIAGIGLYSFPYTSYLFNKLPKYLFDEYVSGLTAHLTYLAVIVETGIIGLIGFLIFIYSILKNNFKLLNNSQEKQFNILNLSVGWGIIYIMISMFVTDAWLWGQGIILFGIFIGLILAMLKLNIEPIKSE